MTKEEIQALYKAHILPENKLPYHFEANLSANTQLDAYNPMCGDKFHLHLNVKEDRFDEVNFEGFGCAISKASTSILLKKIEGISRGEAKVLCDKFINSLMEESPVEKLGDELDTLVTLKDFDGRVDCIKLSWEALLEYLNKV